ncbi:MAG TPA: Spy/CpxP family protein refolding chaperone [Candidatus Thermoplasmatota archaeon]|nr:Spy/CpxP family protein refolding chaperone [Candidatus Thermoplasmatota archaeon]
MRATMFLMLAALVAGCNSPPSEGPSYPDLLESPIRGLSLEQISSLENGSGSGLALPAELNGYPGPKHILEFQEELGLNDTQRQQITALFDSMRAEAKAGGQRVLAAYRALDQWFREEGRDAAELEPLLLEVGEAEAQLRGVHLRAHLASLPLLTIHQRAMYQELRGYGEADHGQHGH